MNGKELIEESGEANALASLPKLEEGDHIAVEEERTIQRILAQCEMGSAADPETERRTQIAALVGQQAVSRTRHGFVPTNY